MAGGMSKRGGGIPMEQRVQLGLDAAPAVVPSPSAPSAPSQPTAGEPPARHCWVLAPADGSGERRPGLLLEWRRDDQASWTCRVVYSVRLRTGAWGVLEEWLPAADVAPG